MMSSLLVLVIVSSSWLESVTASAECTGGNSVLVVPSSGPAVCLPLDDYIELHKDASSEGESTDVPPPTSAASASTPSQSGLSSVLLLYRYMSPLWLQTHANFTETPSSVSAQTIDFGIGLINRGVLFRVNLFEAGILDDDKSYSIQIGFFFTEPVEHSGVLQICDGTYCVGFEGQIPPDARFFGGNDLASLCSRVENSSPVFAPQSSNTWNSRIEIHPNATSGVTYVSTTSATYEYNQPLKPSQGLQFKVCRRKEENTPTFHLFELGMYLNE